MSRTVIAGSALAAGLTAHTLWNLRALPEPDTGDGRVAERVSILIPARDEVDDIVDCVHAALAQEGVADLEVIVLDDASTDGTSEVLRTLQSDLTSAGDRRLTVLTGRDEPPAGWLGKSWACQRLAQQATGSVLFFTDADVRLAPRAALAAVRALRQRGLALLTGYPHQESDGLVERLVQPMLVWSWATTLPLTIAERSRRSSMSAANGQFMVFDRDGYWQAGGHETVAGQVLEDIALMRAIKRVGLRGGLVNAASLATCRMYRSGTELRDGYTKSLWAAFGGPVGTTAVCGALGLAYCLPAAAVLGARSPATRAVGSIGYAAGVAGRVAVATRTGERTWPDSAAHPASVALFIGLNAWSWMRRIRGGNTWKGRTVR